jgi:beta-alanine--pyruvate transaminase
MAAGLAMQDIIQKENLFERSKEMSPYFLDGLFSLKDLDIITDIRGYGMMGGIDVRFDESPGKAGFSCFKKLFEAGLSLKATGDCLILAPPFICEKSHIDEIIEKLRTGISNYAKTR